jgi:hypothetical protein
MTPADILSATDAQLGEWGARLDGYTLKETCTNCLRPTKECKCSDDYSSSWMWYMGNQLYRPPHYTTSLDAIASLEGATIEKVGGKTYAVQLAQVLDEAELFQNDPRWRDLVPFITATAKQRLIACCLARMEEL